MAIIKDIISTGTMLVHIFAIVLFLASFWYKKKILSFIKKYTIQIIFFMSTIATLGSLYFSEILNYTPCTLCWYQRIMMYPIVLLSGIAWYKKDKQIYYYLIPISIIGGLIALYHYIGRLIPAVSESTSCGITTTSCFIEYFTQYGYVTIPLMALTAFSVILITSIVAIKIKR